MSLSQIKRRAAGGPPGVFVLMVGVGPEAEALLVHAVPKPADYSV